MGRLLRQLLSTGLALAIAAVVLAPHTAIARSRSGYSHRAPKTYAYKPYHAPKSPAFKPYRAPKAYAYKPYYAPHTKSPSPAPHDPYGGPAVQRDGHGRIKRSAASKQEFKNETGYPHGRPGYVIDHIVPIARGGADAPGNMQWQTIDEAKAKDKVELGPHPHRGRRHK